MHSSAGRASPLQGECRRFDPVCTHHFQSMRYINPTQHGASSVRDFLGTCVDSGEERKGEQNWLRARRMTCGGRVRGDGPPMATSASFIASHRRRSLNRATNISPLVDVVVRINHVRMTRPNGSDRSAL